MSAHTIASTSAKLNSSVRMAPRPAGAERRRRRRAKISGQVHVQPVNSIQPFEELCKSVDVSRDGLLFTASRTGYWKGQALNVTFPYSSEPTALNQAQRAEIVRVTEQPGGGFSIAVQFLAARFDAKQERKNGIPQKTPAREAGIAPAQEKQQSIVLAVESDQRTGDMMRVLLQQDGYTVIIVPTAKAALEILKTTVPAVFLAEVEAEDMSGQDLCLIIKRSERLQRVPVILLTRAAQPADYSASHQLGAVVCMAKPFKSERLLHVIRMVAPPPSTKNVYGSRVSSGTIERTL